MGNLSMSTHVRAFAFCSPDTMHLSTSVSPPLGVWQLQPDFNPKQLCCFAHGTCLLTNTHTHTHGPFRITQEKWSSFTNTCINSSFFAHKTVTRGHHCNKANTCNNHYTPRKEEKKLTTSLSLRGGRRKDTETFSNI